MPQSRYNSTTGGFCEKCGRIYKNSNKKLVKKLLKLHNKYCNAQKRMNVEESTNKLTQIAKEVMNKNDNIKEISTIKGNNSRCITSWNNTAFKKEHIKKTIALHTQAMRVDSQ